MKRIILAISALSICFVSCQDAPKADEAKVGEAQTVEAAATGATYTADTTQSKVEWVGTKPTGRHHGTIGVKEGSLTADANGITGGKFVLNVASLKADDQDAEGNAKLAGHLSSPDFFDAAKYPTATFEITSVKPGVDSAAGTVVAKDATHTITGNLTLKDQTKSITFPAKVAVTDANVTADANFNIDRTLWGMNYMGDASVQDKFISHEVNLTLHLVANK